jgi:hypothetical protein
MDTNAANIANAENGVTKTETYYFPLKCSIWERGEYGDYDDYPAECGAAEALRYRDEIEARLKRENERFDTQRMLAEYLPDGELKRKILSMTPTVEERAGQLWGAMVMEISGELSSAEIAGLKAYIVGQNADGFGESFEQREIAVPDGEMYVHFWNSGGGYAVYTRREFDALIEQTQSSGHEQRERVKLEAALVGADGNVFNLLGIASSALKRAGLREEAAEMRSRVMDSGSYGNALAIMTEYVEPVGADERQERGGMRMSM